MEARFSLKLERIGGSADLRRRGKAPQATETAFAGMATPSLALSACCRPGWKAAKSPRNQRAGQGSALLRAKTQ